MLLFLVEIAAKFLKAQRAFCSFNHKEEKVYDNFFRKTNEGFDLPRLPSVKEPHYSSYRHYNTMASEGICQDL